MVNDKYLEIRLLYLLYILKFLILVSRGIEGVWEDIGVWEDVDEEDDEGRLGPGDDTDEENERKKEWISENIKTTKV